MQLDFSKLQLENQLCFPLYAASRLTTQMYEPYLKELDLTYPQYLVLLVLWEHPSLTVTEIGNKLLLASNTLTPLLKRLEQRNLVKRTRSQHDERSVIVSLTPEAELLKMKAVTIPEKIMCSFADQHIGIDELQQFQATLWKLVHQLDQKVNAG